MSNSRSKNAIRNIIFGYMAQFGIIVLSFVGRKIFLQFLTIDYLGINGLYSNILTVLSLPELGFDAAVLYSLYRPVAEDNKPLVYSMLRYFKKIYVVLAITIFAIGIAITPFLKYIIDSNLPETDLIIYYILFLTNTVASYFVGHKIVLLFAYQEQRIQKLITLMTNFVLQFVYIIVLIVWHNYYIYIASTVITTILNNIILNTICNKIHKDIFIKQKSINFEKKIIIRNVSSTFLYKIGAVAINNTDNILISMLISTAAVGLYSNYYTVIGAVQGFIAIITNSLISGIGNLCVTDDKKKQYEVFNMLLLFYHFIASLGAIGFGLLINDFISIWLGSEYLFEQSIVIAIVLNFYITNAISPVWMYREANGLFNRVKYLMLLRAIINIILSIFMGKYWGVMGIFAATTVSLVLTSFWYEPSILFKNIFGIPSKKYWLKQVKYFLVSTMCFIISRQIMSRLPDEITGFTLKAIIIIIINVSIFFVSCFKSDEVKRLKSILKIVR